MLARIPKTDMPVLEFRGLVNAAERALEIELLTKTSRLSLEVLVFLGAIQIKWVRGEVKLWAW